MKKILHYFTFIIAIFFAIGLASCDFDSVTELTFSGTIKKIINDKVN